MSGSAGGGRRTLVTVLMIVALVVGIFVSVASGQLTASVRDVIGTALDAIGIHASWVPEDEIVQQTLLQIRFPRVAMSILVGAALAVGGAVMQAIFGNPLAEPGIVGVSSGAAVGAAAAITFSISILGDWGVAAMAFAGGFVATVFVYLTARSNGRTEVVTLLLTGIAINAFAGAALALLMFAGNTSSREQIIFWQLGSMNGSRWHEVLVVAVVTIPCAIAAIALSRRYDLLALGERTATHLGLKVEHLRLVSITLVALLTAGAVAFAGIISFVGLVVPHAVRMLIGPAHRPLVGLSLIGGAALLVWADLAARTFVSGVDLPIGMLTALIGGPFFFFLIRSARSRAGGWA